MKILAWIVLASVLVVILGLLYYLIVGAVLFKVVFSRKSVTNRVLRKDIEKDLEKYKIDLCWWDKHKFTRVTVQSYDQLKLVGRFHNANSNKTVIVVHGFGQNYQEMQQYCQFFYERNFNVLAVDNRAHGESEGRSVGFGWLDRKDILSWVNYLNEKQPENQILLFGLSMGGTAVCCVSGENLPNNVVGLISDCAFANADRQISHIMKRNKLNLKFIKNHLYSFSKRVHGLDVLEIDAIKQVKNCKIPILFLHGGADNFVPVENIFDLYNAAPENLKEKHIIEGAEHAMSYPIAGVLYERIINEFLKKRTKIE